MSPEPLTDDERKELAEVPLSPLSDPDIENASLPSNTIRSAMTITPQQRDPVWHEKKTRCYTIMNFLTALSQEAFITLFSALAKMGELSVAGLYAYKYPEFGRMMMEELNIFSDDYTIAWRGYFVINLLIAILARANNYGFHPLLNDLATQKHTLTLFPKPQRNNVTHTTLYKSLFNYSPAYVCSALADNLKTYWPQYLIKPALLAVSVVAATFLCMSESLRSTDDILNTWHSALASATLMQLGSKLLEEVTARLIKCWKPSLFAATEASLKEPLLSERAQLR